jgi:hypothetical protein
MSTKLMNHSVYQAGLKSKSREELDYIIKDAGETIRVNPTGVNVGYYTDEIHYACMEIERRRTKRKAKRQARQIDEILELIY